MNISISNQFLNQNKIGNIGFKPMILTLITTLVGVIFGNQLFNLVYNQVLKKSFPNYNFKNSDFVNFGIIIVVFGIGLIVFKFAFEFFYKRSIMTLITTKNRFRWNDYFLGFVIYSFLIVVFSRIFDQNVFNHFISKFSPTNFALVFFIGFAAFAIQTFFEELIFRGFIFQSLNYSRITIYGVIIINAILFGLLHAGYGISNLIESAIFAFVFCLIVLIKNGIELASGAHLANNLMLVTFLSTFDDQVQKPFSWDYKINETLPTLLVLFLLLGFVFFTNKKHNYE
jgi:uncharacterized protein